MSTEQTVSRQQHLELRKSKGILLSREKVELANIRKGKEMTTKQTENKPFPFNDSFIERHFQTWVKNGLHDDERDTIEPLMRKIATENPGVINHGWPSLRDYARTLIN